MTARLPYEELARRRTKRRIERIRQLIQDIASDWYGEIDSICDRVDELGHELDHFEKAFDQTVEHVIAERAAGDAESTLPETGTPAVAPAGVPQPPAISAPETVHDR